MSMTDAERAQLTTFLAHGVPELVDFFMRHRRENVEHAIAELQTALRSKAHAAYAAILEKHGVADGVTIVEQETAIDDDTHVALANTRPAKKTTAADAIAHASALAGTRTVKP